MNIQTDSLTPRDLLSLLFTVACSVALCGVIAVGDVLGANNRPSDDVMLSTVLKSLPLSFEPVHWKNKPDIRFGAHADGLTLLLTADGGVAVSPSDHDRASGIRMRLIGANSVPTVVGLNQRSGKNHYLLGASAAGWTKHVSQYERIRYESVYPGIDLLYYGSDSNLEFDFVVGAGVDPSMISFAFEALGGGASRSAQVSVDATDNVAVILGKQKFHLKKPHIYQTTRGRKTTIPGRFVVKATAGPAGAAAVAFEVGNYDRSKPLIIDPILTYSTRLGGLTGLTRGRGIAVDSEGMIYVVGETFGDIFPRENPLHEDVNPGGSVDAFVTKINPNNRGEELIYSTRLGGTGFDKAFSVAVDSLGQAYVTGTTSSEDFPAVNALYPEFGGGGRTEGDAFVVKLSADGSELYYATYLGGSGNDLGAGIALAESGMVVVTGETQSTDFPMIDALDEGYGGGAADAFVAAIDPSGSSMLFSTYLGGEGDDAGTAIALDPAGNVYVTGHTRSLDFMTVSPWQSRLTSEMADAFVTKLSPAGDTLIYSTYLGGSASDRGQGIAADVFGHAYVTGRTDSPDFPSTVGVIQPELAGETDAFVTKLNPDGASLAYSTYLGGRGSDDGRGIVVDGERNAYIIGETASSDFLEVLPLQGSFGGGQDAFLTILGPRGATLGSSTYFGGGRQDTGHAIALGPFDNIYLAGVTRSVDIQTVGTFNNLLGQASSGAAFIARVEPGVAALRDLPDLRLNIEKVKLGSHSSGDKVVVKFRLQNVGTAVARGPFVITLLLSTNSRLDDRDIAIQSLELDSLEPGSSIAQKFKVTGLDFIDTQFVIILVDDENVVRESNEGNNVVVREFVGS